MGATKNDFIESQENSDGLAHELNLFLEPKSELVQFPIAERSILNAGKGDILELASDIIQNVNDGILDGVDAKVFAKKIELFAVALKEGLKGMVNIPQPKDYKKHGVSMSEQMMGVRYDYSNCNHPRYNELLEQQNVIDVEMKAIEAQLKALKSTSDITDEETGETFANVMPPTKTGTLSIVMKLVE